MYLNIVLHFPLATLFSVVNLESEFALFAIIFTYLLCNLTLVSLVSSQLLIEPCRHSKTLRIEDLWCFHIEGTEIYCGLEAGGIILLRASKFWLVKIEWLTGVAGFIELILSESSLK